MKRVAASTLSLFLALACTAVLAGPTTTSPPGSSPWKALARGSYELDPDFDYKNPSGVPGAPWNGPNEGYPTFKGALKGEAGESLEWEESCFKKTVATLEWTSDKSVELTLTVSEKLTKGCYDSYLHATVYGFRGQVVTVEGPHKKKIKITDPEEVAEIKTHGLNIFTLPVEAADVLGNFYELVQIMMSDEDANREFVEEKMDFKYKARSAGYLKIPHEKISSGDQFAVTRFKGTHSICQYLTGGRTGHVAIALWDGDKLMVVESTASGIQRWTYEDWMAHNSGNQALVSWLPLRSDLAEAFDAKAAWDYFKTVEGLPYGFGTYMFPALDTEQHSLPPGIGPEYAELLLVILDHLVTPDAMKVVLVGFNQRLGTSGLNADGIIAACREKGISLMALAAIPEEDDWLYDGKPMLVCSQIVTQLYRRAGVLGDMASAFKCGEQSPKDNYQMKMFQPSWTPPDECKGEATVAAGYCQVMGKFVQELPGFNTLELYKDMNDHCPAIPPAYPRDPPNC